MPLVSKRGDYWTHTLVTSDTYSWRGYEFMAGLDAIDVDGGMLPARASAEGKGGKMAIGCLRGEDVAFLQELTVRTAYMSYAQGARPTGPGPWAGRTDSVYGFDHGNTWPTSPVADTRLRARRLSMLSSSIKDILDAGAILRTAPSSLGYSVKTLPYDMSKLADATGLLAGAVGETSSSMKTSADTFKSGTPLRLSDLVDLYLDAGLLRKRTVVLNMENAAVGGSGGTAYTYHAEQSKWETGVNYYDRRGNLTRTEPPRSLAGRTEDGPAAMDVSVSRRHPTLVTQLERGCLSSTGTYPAVLIGEVERYFQPPTDADGNFPSSESERLYVAVSTTAYVDADASTISPLEAVNTGDVVAAALGEAPEETAAARLPEPPEGSTAYHDNNPRVVGYGELRVTLKFPVYAVVVQDLPEAVDFEKAYPGWTDNLPG